VDCISLQKLNDLGREGWKAVQVRPTRVRPQWEAPAEEFEYNTFTFCGLLMRELHDSPAETEPEAPADEEFYTSSQPLIARQGMRWEGKEVTFIRHHFHAGKTLADIARLVRRTPNAVRAQFRAQGEEV